MAIFFALIFQVLFVLFAMIVNVGLLVHHKINLQNSADLAAYYGAMKQAEMMNAMAHINYQIRQSWKLLAWRYRVLGTGGYEPGTQPYLSASNQLRLNDAFEMPVESMPANEQEAWRAPVFCVYYQPFRQNKGQNTCKGALRPDANRITLFKAPPVIAGFLGITGLARSIAQDSLEQIQIASDDAGEFNWTMLARFVVGFNLDQADRKLALIQLARGLSKSPEDFNELNGQSVKVGLLNTLKKNLTIPNRESLRDDQVKIINGLGHERCSAASVSQFDPPKWLSEVKIAPAFFTLDQIAGDSSINFGILNLSRDSLPRVQNKFTDEIAILKDYVDPLAPPYNSSLGYEKNPWCMAYVGVVATTAPKIPFSPLGEIKMTAIAFAKPFGGRMGPWYNKIWDPSSPKSNRGDRTDELVPTRVDDPSSIPEPRDFTRIPNYARFPGDQLGLISRNTLGRFHRLFYDLNQGFNTRNGQFARAQPPGPPPTPTDTSPDFNYWSHVHKPYPQNLKFDTLSWDSNNNFAPRQRELELLAIAPDLFDITYYSIEPDFYNNYYKTIKQEYLRANTGFQPQQFRPDHGGQVNSTADMEAYNVKKQIEKVAQYAQALEIDPVGSGGAAQGLTYLVKDVNHLLTGWTGTHSRNFDLDPEKFGKCKLASLPGTPAPGLCVDGGRTGYSVKLVSYDYLHSQDLQLGGEGGTQGPILNPPNIQP